MKILENVDLADYSSFKIGGKAKVMYIPESVEELIQLTKNNESKLPLLGNGSNILINDKKVFENVVLVNKFNNRLENLGNGFFIIGASVKLSKAIKFVNENNYGGLENLYMVPGLIGGALVSNAGNSKLKGDFIGNYIVKVKVLIDNQVRELSKEECKFGFRDSIFKKSKNIVILEAMFKFDEMTIEQIESRKKDKLTNVRKHQKLSIPSLGSIFSQANGKILRIVRLFFYPFHRKGVRFSNTNPSWLCNYGKGTFKQTVRIINTVIFLHKICFQKISIEIDIWE